jgi:hypothetical protein
MAGLILSIINLFISLIVLVIVFDSNCKQKPSIILENILTLSGLLRKAGSLCLIVNRLETKIF